jgi:hypothetical protein
MAPETKRWAWIGGLAAGTAALVSAIVFWPKKASAATPPQKGYVKYTSTLSTSIFQAKVGDTLTLDLPSLEGTPYQWHVEGAESLVKAQGELGGNVQTPGPIVFTFVKPGSGTIFVSKINQQRQGVEPAMAVNFAVSA